MTQKNGEKSDLLFCGAVCAIGVFVVAERAVVPLGEPTCGLVALSPEIDCLICHFEYYSGLCLSSKFEKKLLIRDVYMYKSSHG